MQTAMLCSVFASALSGKEVSYREFIPHWETQPPERTRTTSRLDALAAALGAEVIVEHADGPDDSSQG